MRVVALFVAGLAVVFAAAWAIGAAAGPLDGQPPPVTGSGME